MITEEQAGFAETMLKELETEKLRIGTIPAPEQRHSNHKIRVVLETNPVWYSDLYNEIGYVDRRIVLNSLKRISKRESTNYKYDAMMLDVINEQIENFQAYCEEGKYYYDDYDGETF